MELTAQRCADVVLLCPRGRIDQHNAETFAQLLAPHAAACKAGGDALLFDLGGLEYISSAGLRVFMLLSKSIGPASGRVALTRPQRVVAEILEISRFKYVFPIHASVAAGLAALSSEAAATFAGA